MVGGVAHTYQRRAMAGLGYCFATVIGMVQGGLEIVNLFLGAAGVVAVIKGPRLIATLEASYAPTVSVGVDMIPG